MKLIPIGTDDFKTLRATSYYVDHTQIIEDLESVAPTVPVLYLRPRRFGKSLCLSMLQAFYESNVEERKALFGNLLIEKNERLMSKEACSVIFLRLKEIKSNNIQELKNDLSISISDEFRRHFQNHYSNLDQFDAEFVKKAISATLSDAELKVSIRRLSEIIYRTQGKRPYLLIDEYDAPINFAEEKGYSEEATSFLKPFYGNSLKGNPYIEKAIITGVLKFSKISLHSDLNNPIVDTGIETPFKERFAFSYDEVRSLLQYYGRKNDFDIVTSWYGGFHYGDGVYANPWSVLSYLFYKGQAKPYWTSTASTGGLLKIVKGGMELIEPLQSLINEDGVFLANPTDSGDYGNGSVESLYTFLLYSGYLAVKEYTGFGSVKISFPNIETRRIFTPVIIERFEGQSNTTTLLQCAESFYRGDKEMIEKIFRTLLSSFSYFEFSSEEAYKVMVLTLTYLMFQRHIVKAEVNAGIGRCDIMISPINENDYGAIIEIKHLKTRTTDERLRSSADSALRQIKTHDYHEELCQRKCKTIYAFGMSFYKKSIAVSKEKLK